jgi:hypothetical protein
MQLFVHSDSLQGVGHTGRDHGRQDGRDGDADKFILIEIASLLHHAEDDLMTGEGQGHTHYIGCQVKIKSIVQALYAPLREYLVVGWEHILVFVHMVTCLHPHFNHIEGVKASERHDLGDDRSKEELKRAFYVGMEEFFHFVVDSEVEEPIDRIAHYLCMQSLEKPSYPFILNDIPHDQPHRLIFPMMTLRPHVDGVQHVQNRAFWEHKRELTTHAYPYRLTPMCPPVVIAITYCS